MSAAGGALPSDITARNRKTDSHRPGHRPAGHGGPIEATGRGEGGPASRFVTSAYGFWIFLLSDIIMFSAFFAAYAVLSGETDGGPDARALFEPSRVAVQTFLLLTSSFTVGLAGLAAGRRNMIATEALLLVTGVLGAGFLYLELSEFAGMIAEGAGPGRSAFLSSFFALVGCHGIHVTLGLLWLATLMAQLPLKGFRPEIMRRLHCFNLFWHALDIIWVAIFTLVYLLGASR